MNIATSNREKRYRKGNTKRQEGRFIKRQASIVQEGCDVTLVSFGKPMKTAKKHVKQC